MAIPTVNWATLLADASSLLRLHGIDTSVTLKEGKVFALKASRATPATLSQDLTAGLTQSPLKMIVLYEDWHAQTAAGPGRKPQRGDVLLQLEAKYSIQSAMPLGVGSTVFGYTMQVLG